MEEDVHPSLETLARWLAGELEHEQVLREVVPHLVARCPVCRRLGEEIRQSQVESGHWSEVVAVLEMREAPALAATLQGQPHEEQMRRAEADEGLHTWGLCQFLLRASREAVFQEPSRAVELAQLAVRLSHHLGEAYHPDWVLLLRARAYAQLGNARRVLGEPKGAEYAFLRAEACVEASTAGDIQLEAEILRLKASLRLDQRLFEEALDLLERSIVLSRAGQDDLGAAKALIKKVRVFQVREDLGAAILLLQENAVEIEKAGDLRLFAYSRQHLVTLLAFSGRSNEAKRLLPEVQALFREVAEPVDWIKLRWTEASIAQGLGRLEEAEEMYREVQRAFVELGKGYDAALVSLDLAALLAQMGRTAELKSLAAEILTSFEARGVDREALASFLLFQQACSEERATLEMARRLGTLLRRTRPDLS